MTKADELRRELEILRELREMGEPEESEIDEGQKLILLELLGEFRKQQIVQETDDPTLGAEHYALSSALDQASVEALEEQGWIDPHGRSWNLVPPADLVPPFPRPAPIPRASASPNPYEAAATRPRLRPALPDSLRDQVQVEVKPGDPLEALAALLAEHPKLAGLLRPQGTRGDPDLLEVDDDTPLELRTPGSVAPAPVKRAKVKKPKKKAAAVTHRYADGSLIEAPATVESEAVAEPGVPTPIPHDPAAASPQVGWVKGPDGRLVGPPRAPVKAVYPPIRGKGTPPPGLSLGGLTTSNDWVRDPSSGRKVPASQVEGQ